MGEGPGVSLEGSGEYGYVNRRKAEGDVGSCGKSNVTGTTDKSIVLQITN